MRTSCCQVQFWFELWPHTKMSLWYLQYLGQSLNLLTVIDSTWIHSRGRKKNPGAPPGYLMTVFNSFSLLTPWLHTLHACLCKRCVWTCMAVDCHHYCKQWGVPKRQIQHSSRRRRLRTHIATHLAIFISSKACCLNYMVQVTWEYTHVENLKDHDLLEKQSSSMLPVSEWKHSGGSINVFCFGAIYVTLNQRKVTERCIPTGTFH